MRHRKTRNFSLASNSSVLLYRVSSAFETPMPSGRTHDRITFWCLPAIAAITGWLTHSPALIVIVSLSFLVGGLMLGPDLDIHSVQYRRWGPLRWIWLPYRKALRHRSRLSHGPIIGTALRVIYLSAWIALFAFLTIEALNALWNAQLTWQNLRSPFRALMGYYLVEWLAVLIGLELGALSHSISDFLGSHVFHRRGYAQNRSTQNRSTQKRRKKHR
jgi:uncharacterized metal-binding protein